MDDSPKNLPLGEAAGSDIPDCQLLPGCSGSTSGCAASSPKKPHTRSDSLLEPTDGNVDHLSRDIAPIHNQAVDCEDSLPGCSSGCDAGVGMGDCDGVNGAVEGAEGCSDDDDDDDGGSASEKDWSAVDGPIATISAWMKAGLNPRIILARLCPELYLPKPVSPSMLWQLIFQRLTEAKLRTKLPQWNTLEDAARLIKERKKIMIITGAGVSVSCGIPDFRSQNGIYARLHQEYPDLPNPQAMFDIYYFRKNPKPFFNFAKEIYPGNFKPSLTHRFVSFLNSQGKLLRNYSQNIDCLESIAGIKDVVLCHGSFLTASCCVCRHKVSGDEIKADVMNQTLPRCPKCPPDKPLAIMKPDIVFFGESLPTEFHDQMARDKDEVDLLILIGSSMKVRPVNLIPNSLPESVPQILINRDPLPAFNFDINLLGKCDDIIRELSAMIGGPFETEMLGIDCNENSTSSGRLPAGDCSEFSSKVKYEPFKMIHEVTATVKARDRTFKMTIGNDLGQHNEGGAGEKFDQSKFELVDASDDISANQRPLSSLCCCPSNQDSAIQGSLEAVDAEDGRPPADILTKSLIKNEPNKADNVLLDHEQVLEKRTSNFNDNEISKINYTNDGCDDLDTASESDGLETSCDGRDLCIFDIKVTEITDVVNSLVPDHSITEDSDIVSQITVNDPPSCSTSGTKVDEVTRSPMDGQDDVVRSSSDLTDDVPNKRAKVDVADLRELSANYENGNLDDAIKESRIAQKSRASSEITGDFISHDIMAATENGNSFSEENNGKLSETNPDLMPEEKVGTDSKEFEDPLKQKAEAICLSAQTNPEPDARSNTLTGERPEADDGRISTNSETSNETELTELFDVFYVGGLVPSRTCLFLQPNTYIFNGAIVTKGDLDTMRDRLVAQFCSDSDDLPSASGCSQSGAASDETSDDNERPAENASDFNTDFQFNNDDGDNCCEGEIQPDAGLDKIS